MVASTLLSLSVLGSGFFYGSKSLPLVSLISVAWADGDNDDQCDKCKSGINVIRDSGEIHGTNHEDLIVALGNGTVDDTIFGEDRSDIIFGDAGVDTIYGGSGSDTVQGGPGNDQIFGKDGDDNLFGGFEDDFLVGGRGSDHMFGDVGNDVLAGGPGADYFDCGDGYDMIMDFKLEQGDITAGNCEVF
jgi:Ca2+-binding RTX toxin-like protein